MFTKTHAVVLIALIQCVPLTIGLPNVISFGDFMEFMTGLLNACGDVTVNDANSKSSVKAIWNSFEACTANVGNKSETADLGATYENICRHRGEYFKCWDSMKADTLKACGNSTESNLPAVYRATVTSYCGTDNGAAKSAALREAVAEIKDGDYEKCPKETGIHWFDNCRSLLITMVSSDICARHEAIDKCMRKITCENVKYAKMQRELYTEGKPYLQCNGRRA